MAKKIKPIVVNFLPTIKQAEAWNYLTSPDHATVSEIILGGGAGSGKSFFGCSWLLINCLNYPGTRWLLGRSKLTDLKKTTLATMFDVLSTWNIPPTHYNYNQQDNIIKFVNGSEIFLKDLMLYPTDPNFDSLGSLEITGAFLDEVNMISEKAKNIVSSRIRYKLEKYNLFPKLLMTCNPAKNWVYDQFYKPWKNNSLLPYRKFVQALVTDNPHISPHYKEQLSRLDEISKRRLLFGEWELENENNLIQYDKILSLFNTGVDASDEYYISADCSRLGKDRSVIFIWKGTTLIDFFEFEKNSVPQLASKIIELGVKYNVQRRNIIVDSDGVGGGVADLVRGCKHFVNNQKAEGNANYQHLKSQCTYVLADLINQSKININLKNLPIETKSKIIQELELVRSKDLDKDGKLKTLSKEDFKALIGRSPDYLDTLMMFAWFHIPDGQKITGEYFFRTGSFSRA